jgi:cytochrome P450
VADLDDLLSLQPDAISCPYPYYQGLRAEGPVVYDAGADIYVVTRHAEIIDVNSQAQVFSNQNPMGPAISDALVRIGRVLATRPPDFQARAMTVLQRGNVLFTADPPDHTRHRRILNRALTPSAVSRIEPQIEADCHDLIDRFDVTGPVDVVSEYATPGPIYALSSLLGVAKEQAPLFYEWATAINATIGSALDDEGLLRSLEQQIDFWDFFAAELEARRGSTADDLLARVANGRSEDDQPLTLDEMVGFCSQLIGAGADTTTKLITQALHTLCRDRDTHDRLRNDPGLIPSFLEEMLRLEPPVQGMFRVATKPFEVAGTEIPEGALVWCLYASGNRDDTVFDQPDVCSIERDNVRQHLSFGHGPHVCIGANLARSVSRIALGVFLDRCDDFAFWGATFEPIYEQSYVMHGFAEMALRVELRT